jgi:hypothetical protein
MALGALYLLIDETDVTIVRMFIGHACGFLTCLPSGRVRFSFEATEIITMGDAA